MRSLIVVVGREEAVMAMKASKRTITEINFIVLRLGVIIVAAYFGSVR